MRPVPDTCLGLLHAFEGFRPTRYLDMAGNPTIGWGHLLSGPQDPLWAATLTPAQGDALADQDLVTRAAGPLCEDLAPEIIDALTEGQYAALIDFVFNEGIGHWHGSTVRVDVINGALINVPSELNKWVYGGGAVQQGLVRRRAAEIALWNS
jgi:GH24 family phage-related lysozyme (muramidase)